MRSHPHISRSLWIIVVLAAMGLSSCDRQDEPPIANRRPFVRLTGGPVEGDSVSYQAEFFWAGWDDDGVIDGYQYAVDIPRSFTFDEINDPETKGIAWRDTAVFRARFRFTTPSQDTVIGPGGVTLPDRYKGTHTFYVRSVDNEGGVSEADFLTFTARNITPWTRFTLPGASKSGGVLDVGRIINVAWEGVDPDSPDPRRLPAYYEYKIIPVLLTQIGARVDVTHEVLVSPGPSIAWTRVGADTTVASIHLETPRGYVLAIRAIDEAGGTEHTFLRGRNAVLLSARGGNVDTPILTVSEPSLGTHTFPNDGPVATFEVPVRYRIRFCFTAVMDSYGGELQGFNYGVDVEDVNVDGPASAFRGWSRNSCMFESISFASPGLHTLTVKVRDTGGGVTIGTILLNVIAFPLDREILYVDDFRRARQGNVNDAMMDERVRAMLESVGITEFHRMDAWGDGDLNSAPEEIRLSHLARYRLVFWSVFGSGLSGSNALVRAAVCGRGRVVQSYLRAGGSLWVCGEQVWGSFRPAGTGCQITIPGETSGMNFDAGHFPCDFMKICGGDFREARTLSTNGFTGALPTAGALRDTFPFPPLEIDRDVVNTQGIAFVQAMFQPMFDAGGGLDTLYTMQTVLNRTFHNKPAAFRYRDPDPVPMHGPIAVFGFPYHSLKQGEARPEGGGLYSGTGVHGMAASMMNWFRRHTGRS